jgi:hypothetical protein
MSVLCMFNCLENLNNKCGCEKNLFFLSDFEVNESSSFEDPNHVKKKIVLVKYDILHRILLVLLKLKRNTLLKTYGYLMLFC